MKVENLSTDAESFTCNVYRVNDTALVDTGADPTVLEQLEGGTVETVVVTHTHWDHIENLSTIVEEHSPAVYAYNPDNLSVSAQSLTDGDTVTLAGEAFTVFHTPGHKEDSICLYNQEKNVLFSGDLVFPNGYWGRTDLPGSNHEDLVQSIERVAQLTVEQLFAGHDEPVREHADEHIRDALAHAREGTQPSE